MIGRERQSGHCAPASASLLLRFPLRLAADHSKRLTSPRHAKSRSRTDRQAGYICML